MKYHSHAFYRSNRRLPTRNPLIQLRRHRARPRVAWPAVARRVSTRFAQRSRPAAPRGDVVVARHTRSRAGALLRRSARKKHLPHSLSRGVSWQPVDVGLNCRSGEKVSLLLSSDV
ncbi:Protein of unknown function, partial [Gryllus bimaculatus]